jgi:hypothetical protein
MKLRLKDNSLRVRLSPDEVSQLLAGNNVEAQTRFGIAPFQCLLYSVEAWPDVPVLTVVYKPGHIRILIPNDPLQQWASTDATSMTESQAVGSGQSLKILVEKDLPCKDGKSD